MKQSLVTVKNRKVRKLREKYPMYASNCSIARISCVLPKNMACNGATARPRPRG
jgi:hypothetical protein